ncbi:MAG: hypothetical protein HY898_28655 [Deltaproteobacteria bacterium]|nr:hypothetical protein [Deltaproteobacteria bacterium]
MSRLRLCLPVLACVLYAGLAHADVVDTPPFLCLPGYKGQTSHHGTWCEPPEPIDGCPLGSRWTSRSADDAWCNGLVQDWYCKTPKLECRKVSLCVEEIRRRSRGHGMPPEYVEERVHGYCLPDCSCPSPYKCVTALRRVDVIPDSGVPPWAIICHGVAGVAETRQGAGVRSTRTCPSAMRRVAFGSGADDVTGPGRDATPARIASG